MRTILLSSTAILMAVAIAATGVTDSVQAASRFDGSWTVQIITRRGAERVNDFETPFVMRLASERVCD